MNWREEVVVEKCDICLEQFCKLNNHPRDENGWAKCPHCMAIGNKQLVDLREVRVRALDLVSAFEDLAAPNSAACQLLNASRFQERLYLLKTAIEGVYR